MQPTMISKHAPAKLNLNLHITGKCDNGYHMLESLVVFADIADIMTFSSNPPDERYQHCYAYEDIALTLHVNSMMDVDDAFAKRNLIYLAAKCLAAYSAKHHTGALCPMHITLEKHIPIGAGLGGGSSDAAATLVALNELWQMQLSTTQLQKLAATLGSDIAVCIQPTATWMSGTGNQLAAADIRAELWALILYPHTPLSSSRVYQALDYDEQTMQPLPEFGRLHCYDAESLIRYVQATDNHLTSPAIGQVHDIANILAALNALPGCKLARMSGSGSACFGLFMSEAEARGAAQMIGHQMPAWWQAIAPLIINR